MATSDELALSVFRRERTDESFRALYQLSTPRLYAFGIRLSGSASEAEDLVQETWIRAVRRIDQFAGDAAFQTWLTAILLNCYREWQRKQTRLHVVKENVSDAGVVAHPDPPPQRDLDVDRAVMALPAGYREIIVLHDIYGYTHVEIAEQLDISEGTSKSQLARARTKLRDSLNTDSASRNNQGNGGDS